MFELRWYSEEWIEYPEGSPVHKSDEPILQYRYRINIEEVGLQPPIWSEWCNVPFVVKKL